MCFNNNNFIKLKDKTLLGQKRYYEVAMQLTVIGAPPPGRPNGKFFLFSCISLICKISLEHGYVLHTKDAKCYFPFFKGLNIHQNNVCFTTLATSFQSYRDDVWLNKVAQCLPQSIPPLQIKSKSQCCIVHRQKIN